MGELPFDQDVVLQVGIFRDEGDCGRVNAGLVLKDEMEDTTQREREKDKVVSWVGLVAEGA